ncbi:uncharacterized protein LOC128245930 [Mya arenaria]|uniref:uncharacterized protein LOC128245930 n=1 Tax=Mya arenaria TaxID=6604 RepID=UPI0022E237CE|nr:uncharacterized protein LOC128245930 [Mya arenaria]
MEFSELLSDLTQDQENQDLFSSAGERAGEQWRVVGGKRDPKRKRADTGSVELDSFQTMSTDSKLNVLFTKIDTVEKAQSSVIQVETSLEQVKHKIEEHDDKITTLTYKLIDLQAREKRCNVIIYGLDDDQRKEIYDLVSDFLYDMNLDPDEFYIEHAERLGSSQRPAKPIPRRSTPYVTSETAPTRDPSAFQAVSGVLGSTSSGKVVSGEDVPLSTTGSAEPALTQQQTSSRPFPEHVPLTQTAGDISNLTYSQTLSQSLISGTPINSAIVDKQSARGRPRSRGQSSTNRSRPRSASAKPAITTSRKKTQLTNQSVVSNSEPPTGQISLVSRLVSVDEEVPTSSSSEEEQPTAAEAQDQDQDQEQEQESLHIPAAAQTSTDLTQDQENQDLFSSAGERAGEQWRVVGGKRDPKRKRADTGSVELDSFQTMSTDTKPIPRRSTPYVTSETAPTRDPSAFQAVSGVLGSTSSGKVVSGEDVPLSTTGSAEPALTQQQTSSRPFPEHVPLTQTAGDISNLTYSQTLSQSLISGTPINSAIVDKQSARGRPRSRGQSSTNRSRPRSASAKPAITTSRKKTQLTNQSVVSNSEPPTGQISLVSRLVSVDEEVPTSSSSEEEQPTAAEAQDQDQDQEQEQESLHIPAAAQTSTGNKSTRKKKGTSRQVYRIDDHLFEENI